VRVDQALDDAEEFSDGLLTKVGSFQKLYKQEEFKGKRGVFPSGYLVGCGLMMQPWNAWTV